MPTHDSIFDLHRSTADERFPTEITAPMSVNRLWFLADEADQRAEQVYHRTATAYDGYLERDYATDVPRSRFRTLAERVRRTGAPYGVHTLVTNPAGELLLVRHEGVDMWVLPGGGIETGETFPETARRELAEEAGIEAEYDGLAMLNRVTIESGRYATWGVVPIFKASSTAPEPTVSDPDDEISAAAWFAPDAMPTDTRRRETLSEAVAELS